MARLGHTGFTATLMEYKGKYIILSWSPFPGPIELEEAEDLMDDMIRDMTENINDWRMWYECQPELEVQIVT